MVTEARNTEEEKAVVSGLLRNDTRTTGWAMEGRNYHGVPLGANILAMPGTGEEIASRLTAAHVQREEKIDEQVARGELNIWHKVDRRVYHGRPYTATTACGKIIKWVLHTDGQISVYNITPANTYCRECLALLPRESPRNV